LKSSLCLPSLEMTLHCRVAAAAAVRASTETIAQWRRQPVSVGKDSMPLSFLKHAEDQTVLGLQAVLRTLEQQEVKQQMFADWGVVAASQFLGRMSVAQTLERYHQEGPWAVSPHLIPHQSLHAISGTISQALKIYGPNFGIGGGPHACVDAFLLAAALLADGHLPGLWLIMTGHDAEVIPLRDSGTSTPAMGQALALALTAAPAENFDGLSLSIGQIPFPASQENSLQLLPEFHLTLMTEEWSQRDEMPRGKWRLSETHWIELETVLGAPGGSS
jgi:hypothetical protein